MPLVLVLPLPGYGESRSLGPAGAGVRNVRSREAVVSAVFPGQRSDPSAHGPRPKAVFPAALPQGH